MLPKNQITTIIFWIKVFYISRILINVLIFAVVNIFYNAYVWQDMRLCYLNVLLPKNTHLQKYCLVYFLTFFAYVHFLGCYAQAVAHPFLFMIQFIHQHVYFWIIIYFRDFLCNICLLNEDKYLVQNKHKDMF